MEVMTSELRRNIMNTVSGTLQTENGRLESKLSTLI